MDEINRSNPFGGGVSGQENKPVSEKASLDACEVHDPNTLKLPLMSTEKSRDFLKTNPIGQKIAQMTIDGSSKLEKALTPTPIDKLPQISAPDEMNFYKIRDKFLEALVTYGPPLLAVAIAVMPAIVVGAWLEVISLGGLLLLGTIFSSAIPRWYKYATKTYPANNLKSRLEKPNLDKFNSDPELDFEWGLKTLSGLLTDKSNELTRPNVEQLMAHIAGVYLKHPLI